jgi:glutamate-1-semialdehyde 2,1-aminomutase
MAKEWERYAKTTPGSADHAARSSKTLPLGVTSSFQHWDPYPIGVRSACGAYVTDCDDRQVLDLSMGFGAMLAGHLNPTVVAKVKKSLDDIGTLFVTPSPVSTDVAEKFKERFGLDMLRFTNSGTESTMYAVRVARAYTGRKEIIKIEGGYHGGYDGLSVSVKPGIDEIGPADNPIRRCPSMPSPVVHVVAYNDLGQMERMLAAKGKNVACVVMEPVIENLGIVLPDAGYLADVRALCDAHGVLLIFDEVKTGLTAGAHGAAADSALAGPDHAGQVDRRRPATGAFGGTAEVMQVVVDNRMAHFGTYNGNPLCMAAAAAVDEIATRAGAGRGRAGQRQRHGSHGRHHPGIRTARPHRGLRREGRGDLVTDPDPQLPRLQVEHRFRGRGTGLAVGHQPRCPDASAWTISGWSRWRTPMRTWPSGSTPSVSWPRSCAPDRVAHAITDVGSTDRRPGRGRR